MHNDKNNFMSKARIAMGLAVMAAFLGLAGCGGGGGGGSTTGAAAAPTTPTTPTTPTAPITPVVQQWEQPVTSVPAPTYAAGSAQMTIFTMINQLRGAAGVGLLAQNANIDTAAAAYNNYYFVNYNTPGLVANDEEVQGWAGFTGVMPADRMVAAGYVGTGTQVAGAWWSAPNPDPVACVDNFMDTVGLFHIYLKISAASPRRLIPNFRARPRPSLAWG